MVISAPFLRRKCTVLHPPLDAANNRGVLLWISCMLTSAFCYKIKLLSGAVLFIELDLLSFFGFSQFK